MKRAFAFLLLGAAAAGVTLWWAGSDMPPAPDSPSTPSPAAEELAADRAVSPPAEPPDALTPTELELLRIVSGPFADEQRDAVQYLAARADPAELPRLARFAASLPSLRGRAFTIGALLQRYAAYDSAAALELARELDAPAEVLEALQQITAPDLGAALRRAASLPAAERRVAFEELAARAVADDVYAALVLAERLDPAARDELVAAVLREWAADDAEGVLRYMLTLDEAEQRKALEAAGAAAFSRLTPERMLEIAQQLPGGLADGIRNAGLMGMASANPLAALSRAQALPDGPERAVALAMAARGYAAADPDAAIAWLTTLQPPVPEVVAAVAAQIARLDGRRAMELTLTAGSPSQQIVQLRGLIASGALSSSDIAAFVSDWPRTRLASYNLRLITGTWAARDPEAALEWLLANRDRASAASIAQAAAALGRTNPAAAAARVDQLPGALRASWIKAAAQGYAERNPEAALDWLAPYAGQDGYDAAVAAIAQRAARSDPQAAARIFGRVEPASVAESLGAVNAIASGLSARDVRAARAWATSLPAGELRDAALTPVLLAAATAANGTMDRSLLAEFSSEVAEQRALGEAVVALARTNPAAARRLADEHALPPDLVRFVERLGQ